MNYIYADCLLTDEEIINITRDQPEESVSFFSGNFTNINEVRNTTYHNYKVL